MNSKTAHHPIVSPEEWLAARRKFLRDEKDFSRVRDLIATRRRELPWVKVEPGYVFESTRGPLALADLFEGRSQLIVYHFMLAPGWEEGCRGCSFVSDHFDGSIPHLHARDVSFAAVSRAPLDQILLFKKRMGWNFEWVSSRGTTFNQDFGVTFTPEEAEAGKAQYNFGLNYVGAEEMPGLTVFAKDADGAVYRTYSAYARGVEPFIGAYSLLDVVPKGRDEDSERPMSWVRLHDQYEAATAAT